MTFYSLFEISFIAAACLLIPASNRARSLPAMANLSSIVSKHSRQFSMIRALKYR